jgi:hypothetical protein
MSQLSQEFWRMKWDSARACARDLSGCCGPTRAHQQGQLFRITGQCEHFIGNPRASCKLHSPTRQARAAAQCGLDRPMRDNRPNIKAHTMGPCKGLHVVACKPGRAHQQGVVNSQCGPTKELVWAAILLTKNYTGPHSSLVQQPIVCLMGQYELIVRGFRCINGPVRSHRGPMQGRHAH